MIYVTAGAKTRNWRGVAFTRAPIRGRDNKLVSTWVAGFCTEFEAKDEVKAFVKERGGSWDGVERFWYVPLEGSSVGEILENFWKVAQEGIESFGKYMQMGGLHISVEADIPQAQKEKVINWIEKQAKITQVGLSVVPTQGKVKPMSVVKDIEKQEEENENGVVQYVRYLGTAKGQPEYLYKTPQKDEMFDCLSGVDEDGNTWYWLAGDRLISEGFHQDGGWHREKR